MSDEKKDCACETITINGETYVKQAPNGKRAVVVVDRGWIFAGDVTEENGRIRLSRAVWVFRWESMGFAAMVASPKDKRVDLRPLPQGVDIPADAEVFRIPVGDQWGI